MLFVTCLHAKIRKTFGKLFTVINLFFTCQFALFEKVCSIECGKRNNGSFVELLIKTSDNTVCVGK